MVDGLISSDIVFNCVNVSHCLGDLGLVYCGHQIGNRDCRNCENDRHGNRQFDERETSTVRPPPAGDTTTLAAGSRISGPIEPKEKRLIGGNNSHAVLCRCNPALATSVPRTGISATP